MIEDPQNGNDNGNGHSEIVPSETAGRDSHAIPTNPRAQTLERMEYLWRLSVQFASPTRAVEELVRRDGISQDRAWELWRFAKAKWPEQRSIARNLATTILWHQVQDAILKVRANISKAEAEGKDGYKWYATQDRLFGRAVEIARSAGPEEVNLRLDATITNRREEILARAGRIFRTTSEEDQAEFTDRLARLLTPARPGGDAGHGGNETEIVVEAPPTGT